jgi:hypothetical protein
VAVAFDNNKIFTTNEIVITNLLEISTWIELLVEKVIVTSVGSWRRISVSKGLTPRCGVIYTRKNQETGFSIKSTSYIFDS